MTTTYPQNIAIFGTGRLAWSLAPALQACGCTVSIIGRSPQRLGDFAEAYHTPTLLWQNGEILPAFDGIFLAVSDGAIADIALQLRGCVGANTFVAHTSGSIALDALAPLGEYIGVWYPMQIFTLGKVADFSGASIFVEAKQAALEAQLLALAAAVSPRVQVLSSLNRQKLHLGAVLVCNFTNYLYRLADELVEGVTIQDYENLMRAHIEQVFALRPQFTQTGPAIRGDAATVSKHLDLLHDKPELQALYRMFSLRINPLLPI